MIIDPDMPDHWKTRMLVDLLGGDELAPIYLIRLWGHCQNRKKCEFDSLPPAAVKAICRFPGAPEALNDALIECGFIERDDKRLIVCKDSRELFAGSPRKMDIADAEWQTLREIVFARDGAACRYCGSADYLECDHVIPLSRGGRSRLDNLVTACRACNRSKGAKTPEEWAEVRHGG